MSKALRVSNNPRDRASKIDAYYGPPQGIGPAPTLTVVCGRCGEPLGTSYRLLNGVPVCPRHQSGDVSREGMPLGIDRTARR